ncbi:MAG: efflux RND transporter permease subunit [Isosphaeraceae bacterium]
MLCSRFLKLEHAEAGHGPKSKSGFFYRAIDGGYGLFLRGCRPGALVVVLTLIVIGSTVPIGKVMGLSLIPRDDQSEYEIQVTTPRATAWSGPRSSSKELEQRIRQLVRHDPRLHDDRPDRGRPDRQGRGDVTRGSIYVRMVELEERDYSQFEIQQEARKFLTDYPDLRVSVNDVSAFQGGRRSQTFQVNLAGPDLNQLSAYADRLIAELKREPGLVDLDTTLSLRKPEVQVLVDREAASDLGVPVGTIADTLRILVGGLPVSKFREGDEQYDVWLRAEAGDRASTQGLYQLTLPSPTVGLVKLASLARLIDESGPTEIERLGRERIVTVLGNPDGIALGDAVARATKILDDMKLPPQYRVVFTGQAKTLAETGYYFMVAFLLSMTFMFLILAAQFESWMQPIAILMALPVTIPFGMLSLVLFRTPMDLYAMFGLFMLVGIVKKNGILQVDATNQLREKGLSRHDATVEANHTRLRPILMTTVMLVAAMVPIALGRGPGAGARASMAKVIIGGQMLSLLLALLVTPVFYTLLDMMVNLFRRLGIRLTVEPRAKAVPGASPELRPSVEGA